LDGIIDSRDEFKQTPGDSEGLGSLACCTSWGCKESDMTWLLNNNSYGSYIEINKLTVKFKLKCKQSRISKAILKKKKKLLKDLLIDFNTNFKAIIIHMV